MANRSLAKRTRGGTTDHFGSDRAWKAGGRGAARSRVSTFEKLQRSCALALAAQPLAVWPSASWFFLCLCVLEMSPKLHTQMADLGSAMTEMPPDPVRTFLEPAFSVRSKAHLFGSGLHTSLAKYFRGEAVFK